MRPEEAAPFWRTTVKVFDACTSLSDLEKAPLAQAVTATGHDKQLAALRTEASQIRKELTDRAKVRLYTIRRIAACAIGIDVQLALLSALQRMCNCAVTRAPALLHRDAPPGIRLPVPYPSHRASALDLASSSEY